MEQELQLMDPRVVTPQDVKDFKEAVPEKNYIPLVVLSEASIFGFETKTYLAVDIELHPGGETSLYAITIGRRVVHPEAKWSLVNKSKIILDDLIKDLDFDYKEIHVRPLGENDTEDFYKKYPVVIGVKKTPLSMMLIGRQIGGKEFYIVKVTIMDSHMTSYYELLPY